MSNGENVEGSLLCHRDIDRKFCAWTVYRSIVLYTDTKREMKIYMYTSIRVDLYVSRTNHSCHLIAEIALVCAYSTFTYEWF